MPTPARLSMIALCVCAIITTSLLVGAFAPAVGSLFAGVVLAALFELLGRAR